MYEVRYRIDKITARADGSELVQHDTWAEGREEGEADWQVVPGHHRSLLVPADEIQAALEAGSNAQVIAAYKNALIANLRTPAIPITGWAPADIQAKLEANAASAEATSDAISFITETLGATFPVRFAL